MENTGEKEKIISAIQIRQNYLALFPIKQNVLRIFCLFICQLKNH